MGGGREISMASVRRSGQKALWEDGPPTATRHGSVDALWCRNEVVLTAWVGRGEGGGRERVIDDALEPYTTWRSAVQLEEAVDPVPGFAVCSRVGAAGAVTRGGGWRAFRGEAPTGGS